MTRSPRKLRFLHLHSRFDQNDVALRCVRLIDALGPDIEHTIVSADPDALDAGDRVSGAVNVHYQGVFPQLTGFPSLGRLKKLADAMRGYDLVLSYGWGAIEGAMAHTLFAQAFALPPLIHHEDALGPEEAARLKPRRSWYRRIALGRSASLVVPSRRLEKIATQAWAQPPARIQRIPPGIPVSHYRKKSRPDVLPGLIKRQGESWVGTVGDLTRERNLPLLVDAFADMPDHWQLVLLGQGPERGAILKLAEGLGIEHRVHVLAPLEDMSRVLGLFDIFALSSAHEEFPVSLIEAMAAGLPVAAAESSDIAEMVAAENRHLLCSPGDKAGLSRALHRLSVDAAARKACGSANRAKAREQFDQEKMIARYRMLYASALCRESLP